MASRATLRDKVVGYLGTKSSDPFYKKEDGTSRINDLIDDAYSGILADILQLNPEYLHKQTTLTASPADSRTYPLPDDFAGWISVKIRDSRGTELIQVDRADLVNSRSQSFSLYGPDVDGVLETSEGVTAGVDLYFLYRYWPTAMTDDAHAPSAIPVAFHEVVALDAAEMAYAMGDEQRFPVSYAVRRDDRKAQLFMHVVLRGNQAIIAKGAPQMAGG